MFWQPEFGVIGGGGGGVPGSPGPPAKDSSWMLKRITI